MCGPIGPHNFLKPEVKLDDATLASCPILVFSEHLLSYQSNPKFIKMPWKERQYDVGARRVSNRCKYCICCDYWNTPQLPCVFAVFPGTQFQKHSIRLFMLVTRGAVVRQSDVVPHSLLGLCAHLHPDCVHHILMNYVMYICIFY